MTWHGIGVLPHTHQSQLTVRLKVQPVRRKWKKYFLLLFFFLLFWTKKTCKINVCITLIWTTMISMHPDRPFAVLAAQKYSIWILCCMPFGSDSTWTTHFIFCFFFFICCILLIFESIVTHSTSALIVRTVFFSLFFIFIALLVWFFSAHVKHFPFNSFPLLNTEKRTICTD